MWRIFNLLFGWDYILWQNSCDSGISRLRRDHDDRVWWYRYKTTKCVDTLDQNHQNIKLWLTCSPEKWSTNKG